MSGAIRADGKSPLSSYVALLIDIPANLERLLDRDAEAVRILTAEPAFPEADRRAERWRADRRCKKRTGKCVCSPRIWTRRDERLVNLRCGLRSGWHPPCRTARYLSSIEPRSGMSMHDRWFRLAVDEARQDRTAEALCPKLNSAKVRYDQLISATQSIAHRRGDRSEFERAKFELGVLACELKHWTKQAGEGVSDSLSPRPAQTGRDQEDMIMVDSPDSEDSQSQNEVLRTPEQLLRAFGLAAARHPTRLRVLAIRDAARGDGLVSIPTSFIPVNQSGQPVVGQLNIGGTGNAVLNHDAVFYGLGGARLFTNRDKQNVGFVLYGPPDDGAADSFRALANEAGAVVHVDGLWPGIEGYDSPLVLWTLVVYSQLYGTAWLSQLYSFPETSTFHFHPFTASIETLKALVSGTTDVTTTQHTEHLKEVADNAATKHVELPSGNKPSLDKDSYSDPDNYDRDKWIYEQRVAGRTWPDIEAELNGSHNGWAPLYSENGMRNALKNYCAFQNLEIPKGRSGRPRRQ